MGKGGGKGASRKFLGSYSVAGDILLWTWESDFFDSMRFSGIFDNECLLLTCPKSHN